MSKLGPVATYEVLSSWIASAKNQDHLVCVQNYISSVFLRDYPIDVNELHGELVQSLAEKIANKDLNPEIPDIFKPEGD